MIRPNLVLGATLLALSSFSALAFVPYYAGGVYLARWNPDSNRAHTNSVSRITKKVRYFIASDTWSQANRAAETNAIHASFDQWENVPGSKLKFEFAGYVGPQTDASWEDNTNMVFWAKNNLMVLDGTVNLAGRRGYTQITTSWDDGSILDADIILNGKEFQWFTDFNNKTNQALFIESVLLHEIGHFVGLDHTPIGGATVVSGPAGVGTEAGLSADEVAAMRFLYPDGTLTNLATIKGKITRPGEFFGVDNVHGAAIFLEDSKGNIAGGTVSRPNGDYELAGLPPGSYKLRICPFDPANAPNDRSLMRAGEIHPDYNGAITRFQATTNTPITLTNKQVLTNNFHFPIRDLDQPFRIMSISRPSTINLVSASRTAVTIQPGFYTVGVTSTNFQSGSTLHITGDGLTVGQTIFKEKALGAAHALTVPVIVHENATPGLRSFVVSKGANQAYANGYLEILPAAPDFNFDGLDDRFQRQYFPLWTSTNSAPAMDPDGDKFSNRFEYDTGSNPTNPASHNFAIQSVRWESSRSVVTFKADIGRRYQLYYKDAVDDPLWKSLGGGRPIYATQPVMTIVDGIASERVKYYRLEVLP